MPQGILPIKYESDFAGGHVPSGLFGVNAAWWAIAVLALNLNTLIKQLVLPKQSIIVFGNTLILIGGGFWRVTGLDTFAEKYYIKIGQTNLGWGGRKGPHEYAVVRKNSLQSGESDPERRISRRQSFPSRTRAG